MAQALPPLNLRIGDGGGNRVVTTVPLSTTGAQITRQGKPTRKFCIDLRLADAVFN